MVKEPPATAGSAVPSIWRIIWAISEGENKKCAVDVGDQGEVSSYLARAEAPKSFSSDRLYTEKST